MTLNYFVLSVSDLSLRDSLAVWTGLEPATPCVTGRYSNQLNYHTVLADLHCKDSASFYIIQIYRVISFYYPCFRLSRRSLLALCEE